MTAHLTTRDLLAEGVRCLAATSESPQLDAELLFAHAFGIARSRLKSHPEAPRSPLERDRYLALIARRAVGEPLAYIVEHREFWSLRLQVSPAVLVPRPETELLVERALALGAGLEVARLADLGTGSGAIALALASEKRDWKIVATDASPAALAVARANAKTLGFPNVELLEGHWFEPLAQRRFHLILSNPPYVAADDPALLQPALRYEPQTALTPGPRADALVDALADLRDIIDQAPLHLERDGWILLEHGATQGTEVAGALVARGFRHVTSHRDLAGHERMTEGQWPD